MLRNDEVKMFGFFRTDVSLKRAYGPHTLFGLKVVGGIWNSEYGP